MGEMSGFPFTAIRLEGDGSLASAPHDLVPAGTTDVIVISHGWKNDREDADALYRGILGGVDRAAGAGRDEGGRVWAAVGVYWPAFRFRPDLSLVDMAADDAEGSAAGLGVDIMSPDDLRSCALEVAEEFDVADPETFARLAVEARSGGGRADMFLDRLRELMTPGEDVGADVREEHAELLASNGRELHAALRNGGSFQTATYPEESAAEGAGGGGAAGFERVKGAMARLRSGGAAAIARMLNQATYFEMKARAAVVGAGLARELGSRLPGGVRLHLVGHSFGGRVVTAATATDGIPPVESLSLLQAAYSHNGLGTGFGPGGRTIGGFRRVIEEGRVAGPILVTHTRRDTAVGFFYALASTASGTIANAFGVERLMGGPDDPHGGMGANGALSMLPGEAVEHVADGDPPTLIRGKVNNVLSDAIVAHHNDVANDAVGALTWEALSSRP